MTTTPKLGKGLGRRPDKPDARDLLLPRYAHLGVMAPLPNSADVFAGLNLPVYDQGELGSCTANAGVLYRRWLAQRFPKYSQPDQDLSRLFLYYQERKLAGDVAQDSGASVRDTFRVLTRIGVCPENLDPYIPADFASALDNDANVLKVNAGPYRSGAYYCLADVETAKQCLASGYAIELGFVVYESFEAIGADGIMPMPKPGERVLGGHAVVIYGYDDRRRGAASGAPTGYFRVRNSWGPDWGAKGDFSMPYAFLEDQALSQPDLWVGHLGKPWSVVSGQ